MQELAGMPRPSGEAGHCIGGPKTAHFFYRLKKSEGDAELKVET